MGVDGNLGKCDALISTKKKNYRLDFGQISVYDTSVVM